MEKRRIFLDTSSHLWANLLVGKDEDNGYYERDSAGKERFTNSWKFGLDNALRNIAKILTNLEVSPQDLICVLDGANGKSYRARMAQDYKDGRDKTEGMLIEYAELQKHFIRTMRSYGATVVSHHEWEADDVLVALARACKPDVSVIVTNDKDLLVAVDEVHVHVYQSWELNPDKFGGLPFEFIDIYKATVGDTSDKIPGAKGFGPKAFDKVYKAFGDEGLRELRRLIKSKRLIEIQEDVADVPELQKLIDFEGQVNLSWRLAHIYADKVPVDNLNWQFAAPVLCTPETAGDFSPYLAHWEQKAVLVGRSNYDSVFKRFTDFIKANDTVVGFDIETSTPAESEDWLDQNCEGSKRFIDQFGAELTGFSFTYGLNGEQTMYVNYAHADVDNRVPEEAVRELFQTVRDHAHLVIQNAYYEETVMHEFLGYWLENYDDTLMMASYVDENRLSHGLKGLSKDYLGYEQVSYKDVTQGRKMNELTAEEAFLYGADDTIMTVALYHAFRLLLTIEGTFNVYRMVELNALLMKCQAFVDGIDVDMEALSEMSKRDKVQRDKLNRLFIEQLLELGVEGKSFTKPTPANVTEAAAIKEWVSIVGGEPFKTLRKKFESVMLAVDEVENQNVVFLADLIRLAEQAVTNGDSDFEARVAAIETFVNQHHDSSPEINLGSTPQLQKFLYETLGLPIRLRNPQTDKQRSEGRQGSPKTDVIAIQTALVEDVAKGSLQEAVLKTLQSIKSLDTRFSLFYTKYYNAPHWKDGKLHSFIRQSSTNTRRDSSAQTNLQQLPKGKKGDMRRVLKAHHSDALVVSLDFNAQELRVIADYGRDPNLLSCYVGDNLKDMHGLTAAKMMGISYEDFKKVHSDDSHPDYKKYDGVRKAAKVVNFSSEYGVGAAKLAQSLMCTEEEAQRYLDAKFATFAQSEEWKRGVTAEAAAQGYVTSKLGARRHLRDGLNHENKWIRLKAERQGVNFKIQGSSAEMTKLALGRMWEAKLRDRYDLVFYAPIHDEVVFSIAIDDMPAAICEIHSMMIAPYADMEVPIESSVAAGPNFGDQYEMGDGRPDPERVKKFIQHILEKEAEKAAKKSETVVN